MKPIPTTIPEPLRAFLAEMREARRREVEAGCRFTPTHVREAMEVMTRRYVTRVPSITLVRDEIVPGPDYSVPVRLYHAAPGEPRPVALFVHGGGHVAGSVSLYDPIARRLAEASGWLIISVEYRLAPEYPYPRGLKDVVACMKGIFGLLRTLDPAIAFAPRLALIGDSAGAALCASASHLGRNDPAISIDRQVLIYPSLDYTLSQPSVIENGEGFLLERQRILWMFDCYFQQTENRRSCSPLFMPLHHRYPPTLLAIPEYCPLKDEGIAYARRLREFRIPCEHIAYPGLVHAFLNLEDLAPEACGDLYGRIGAFLAGPPGAVDGF